MSVRSSTDWRSRRSGRIAHVWRVDPISNVVFATLEAEEKDQEATRFHMDSDIFLRHFDPCNKRG